MFGPPAEQQGSYGDEGSVHEDEADHPALEFFGDTHLGEDAADGSVGLTGSTGNEHGYGGDCEVGGQKAYQQGRGEEQEGNDLEAPFEDALGIADDGGRGHQAPYGRERDESPYTFRTAFDQLLGEHRQHREVGEGQNHRRYHECNQELQSGVCGHVGEGLSHSRVGGGGSLAGTLGFRLAEGGEGAQSGSH